MHEHVTQHRIYSYATSQVINIVTLYIYFHPHNSTSSSLHICIFINKSSSSNNSCIYQSPIQLLSINLSLSHSHSQVNIAWLINYQSSSIFRYFTKTNLHDHTYSLSLLHTITMYNITIVQA